MDPLVTLDLKERREVAATRTQREGEKMTIIWRGLSDKSCDLSSQYAEQSLRQHPNKQTAQFTSPYPVLSVAMHN